MSIRRRPTLLALAALAAALQLATPHTIAAQGIRDRLKQRIQKELEKKGDTAATAAPSTATPAAATPAADTPAAPPGAGAWLNYDFVPGDRVIFYEDFTGNEVGDFPRRLRLQEGNMEVVQVQGRPVLRAADGGLFYVKLPEVLPQRFTVEVVYHSPSLGNPLKIWTTAETFQRSASFGCYANQAYVDGNGVGPNSGTPFQTDVPTGFVTCRFTIDNTRGMKAYVDEHRTANAPQDSVVRTDTLFFQAPSASADDPTLVASIRVAAGGKKLYDVLAEKGRVATQGIYFDTGKDVLRPESTPTLAEIGAMLKAHPDLKLTIEGHTDNVGQPAANKALSEKRAAAVKAYLVSSFGIDAARLAAAGYGDTKPAAPNTTPEGRQQNRRVELVKN